LNLGEVWQKANAPVLVISGASDNIMSRADSETIVEIVNRVHPGRARYVQIDGMTHAFTVNGKFYDEVIPTVLNWMKEQLATTSSASSKSAVNPLLLSPDTSRESTAAAPLPAPLRLPLPR